MKELNRENLSDFEKEKLVFVDFWADWCGPCMVFSPVYNKVALQYESKAVFMKCNVDKEQNMALSYGISSVPCVMVFSYGKLIDKLVGLTNEYGLVNFVEKHLN